MTALFRGIEAETFFENAILEALETSPLNSPLSRLAMHELINDIEHDYSYTHNLIRLESVPEVHMELTQRLAKVVRNNVESTSIAHNLHEYLVKDQTRSTRSVEDSVNRGGFNSLRMMHG